jgi:hypothetical protein
MARGLKYSSTRWVQACYIFVTNSKDLLQEGCKLWKEKESQIKYILSGKFG